MIGRRAFILAGAAGAAGAAGVLVGAVPAGAAGYTPIDGRTIRVGDDGGAYINQDTLSTYRLGIPRFSLGVRVRVNNTGRGWMRVHDEAGLSGSGGLIVPPNQTLTGDVRVNQAFGGVVWAGGWPYESRGWGAEVRVIGYYL